MRILTEVIAFGATPEAEAVLAAMRTLPGLLNPTWEKAVCVGSAPRWGRRSVRLRSPVGRHPG
ncbi:hypothetical protein [Spirillospora sp. NPDC048819]|uniref:hypothetical protein n=1 Tax=Spirillospora sp. NPDC048819 TaxID=3155268 RepID=UPI0033C618EE